MIKISNYIKFKGQKNYKKQGQTKSYNCSIDDFQRFNNSSRYRNNKDIDYKAKYSDFGRTYTRTIKSKKTGNSMKTIVKEFY